MVVQFFGMKALTIFCSVVVLTSCRARDHIKIVLRHLFAAVCVKYLHSISPVFSHPRPSYRRRRSSSSYYPDCTVTNDEYMPWLHVLSEQLPTLLQSYMTEGYSRMAV